MFWQLTAAFLNGIVAYSVCRLRLRFHDNLALETLSRLNVSAMFLARLHGRSGCDYGGLHYSKMAAQFSCTADNSLLIDRLSTCDLRLALERVMAKKDQFS